MNLLNWFFSKIDHIDNSNWFSVRYSRWRQDKLNKMNFRFRSAKYKDVEFFDVPGAGTIAISKDMSYYTGNAAGFSLSVGWGNCGLMLGGVLGVNEAKRLADFLIEAINNKKMTEEEMIYECKRV